MKTGHRPAILAVGWERKLSCRTRSRKLAAVVWLGKEYGVLTAFGTFLSLFLLSWLSSDASVHVFGKIFDNLSCRVFSSFASKLSAKKSTMLPLEMQISYQIESKGRKSETTKPYDGPAY